MVLFVWLFTVGENELVFRCTWRSDEVLRCYSTGAIHFLFVFYINPESDCPFLGDRGSYHVPLSFFSVISEEKTQFSLLQSKDCADRSHFPDILTIQTLVLLLESLPTKIFLAEKHVTYKKYVLHTHFYLYSLQLLLIIWCLNWLAFTIKREKERQPELRVFYFWKNILFKYQFTLHIYSL